MTVKIEDMFGNAAYEFIDLIKADPLVSEASFEVKKEVPEVPTQGPEVPKDMTFKTSELTKRMGKNANKIKNNPNHPINRVQKPNIRKEERLVDKILGELEEATPRPKATQRGKISKADAQKRQALEDRKRAARERADDRAKAGIDALIGSDEERKYAKQKRRERGIDENRFASHGGRDTDAGSAYAKPSKGGDKKGVYTLKGKDGKPLFDKREKSNEETEIDEKFNTQYKDKKKLGQSSERKSLGRGSSNKDGSKKTGYESPKEFRDASMSLRKHRERFGDLAKEEVTIDERVKLEAEYGNLLMVVAAWKGKSYQMTMFFPQLTMPKREEVEAEIQKVYPGSRLMSYRITKAGDGKPIMQVASTKSKNYLLNNGDIGEEVEITEDKREEKARRAELAKKHGIDLTKPGSRAKLSRLMKADTISKKRKDAGDVRTDKEVRKDNAINRKEIDKERQHLKQYKTKKGTEARRRVDKKMDDFRRELRSSDKPAEAPPTREKVKVMVGTKVDKPADAPKTGRNRPTAEKRADRKSYEAQQRRNAKEQQNEDWQKVNKGDKTDGMSKKAVAAYRRENPGSKLKTAVTGKVKKGSKDAKRRKSFCARSKGQQDMHNIDCSKTPDKPVCKARRRWKC